MLLHNDAVRWLFSHVEVHAHVKGIPEATIGGIIADYETGLIW